MRRRSKYAMTAIIVVAVVIVFTVVPVVLWFNAYSPLHMTTPHETTIFSVCRSMSCVTLGFGVTYKSAGQYNVWYLGCDPQILVPV